MPKTTGTERARQSRERHKAKGYRYATVRLSPAAQQALSELKGEDDTLAGIVGRLIREAARRKKALSL